MIYPCFELFVGCSVCADAILDVGFGASVFYKIGRLFNTAAARGAEGKNLLARKVAESDKGVYDFGTRTPPNGKSEIDSVIFRKVGQISGNFGTRVGVVLFDVCAAVGVVIVKVVGGVWLGRLNLVNVGG